MSAAPSLIVPKAGPQLIFNPFANRPEVVALRDWTPRTDLGKAIRDARAFLPPELAHELIARIARSAVFKSQISGVLFRESQLGRGLDGAEFLGVLSEKVITTAGVNYLATVFSAGVAGGAIKYHAFGTGTNAENITDTVLQTELTTQYATDNTRPTGSQSASTNTYISTGTLAPDSGGTIAITEHGIASAAAKDAATMWDRSQFAAVNVVASADSLAITYTLTLTAGG